VGHHCSACQSGVVCGGRFILRSLCMLGVVDGVIPIGFPSSSGPAATDNGSMPIGIDFCIICVSKRRLRESVWAWSGLLFRSLVYYLLLCWKYLMENPSCMQVVELLCTKKSVPVLSRLFVLARCLANALSYALLCVLFCATHCRTSLCDLIVHAIHVCDIERAKHCA
jgi:hypothetical protein